MSMVGSGGRRGASSPLAGIFLGVSVFFSGGYHSYAAMQLLALLCFFF